ncbi:MAG: class I SAM-dependent methyltransferase [Deltaproteobacteria bacterium]|nr:class I SAM-dependent methyltransferase [Deltaproteobacteria bacterium]
MEATEYVRGGKQRATYGPGDVVEWPCPLCGEQSGPVLKTERGVLGVQVCERCSLIRVNPRLNRPDEVYRGDVALYEAEYRMVVNGQRPHHRDRNYLHDVELIARHKPAGRFLDIGTSTGAFLRHARDRGWQLTGVEPSPQLAALARKWWGLEVIEGFVEELDLPASSFDVVTMTDVFEHIVNPRQVLAAIRRAIKDDGVLFVKVPNGAFNVLKFRGRSWMRRGETDDFDAYEHVVHYTDETLSAMMRAGGFEPTLVTVEPPVQLPVWHKYVGHYYQHKSPFMLDWRTYSAREALFHLAKIQNAVTGRVGPFAPNIGCLARPK